jgi:DNA-directed RNA polymerase specialized sigma24 family protein
MRAEGFAHREIAAAVGSTTRAIGITILRALKKLERELRRDSVT